MPVDILADPFWMDVAYEYLGVHEISGSKHNSKIMDLLDWADGDPDSQTLGSISDDEVPWCASFVSGVLEKAGVESPRTAWARGFLNWGQKLTRPIVGCVVVFSRGPSSGHVGFVVGKTKSGHLMVLGGNQSDMVKVSAFGTDRILGYRWPLDHIPPLSRDLPVMTSDGKLSKNED